MKLYIFPGSCSLASHIVLRELGLSFELEFVDLRTKITDSGVDYMSVNPRGYVPALLLDDDYVLTEGVAIMQYLADHHAPGTLAPLPGTLDRAKLVSHLSFINGDLQKAIGALFNPALDAAARRAAEENMVAKLNLAESLLLNGESYLLGDRFTIADAYLFVVGRWVPMVGASLAPWPRLERLERTVGERPAVREALTAEDRLQPA